MEKHECSDEIICPYCGYEFNDSWEIDPGEEDIGELDCGNCDKKFYASRNISIDYSTQKIN